MRPSLWLFAGGALGLAQSASGARIVLRDAVDAEAMYGGGLDVVLLLMLVGTSVTGAAVLFAAGGLLVRHRVRPGRDLALSVDRSDPRPVGIWRLSRERPERRWPVSGVGCRNRGRRRSSSGSDGDRSNVVAVLRSSRTRRLHGLPAWARPRSELRRHVEGLIGESRTVGYADHGAAGKRLTLFIRVSGATGWSPPASSPR